VARLTRIAVAAFGGAAAVAASVTVPLVVRRRGRRDQLADLVAQELGSVYGPIDSLAVRAEGGVISLRGEVEDIDDIDRLEAIVRSVPGVTDVDNLLRLRLAGVASRPRVLTA